ncbi:MAG: hypothetical protein Q4D13_01515 [Erysipelotrichaceae bacterium]|nr:hypothetical protein [Erysipelotrichaceae bacterium]
MKKLLCILMVFCVLCGCSSSQKETINYTYDIVAKKVDMSVYKGVNSTDNCFMEVGVSQLFNVIDNESSGLFLLGRSNCNCCQRVTRYINEVGMNLGVTIYYIDANSEEENLVDNKELQDKLQEYMYDILGTDENGEKVLLTPHLFQVINGKLGDNHICFDGLELDVSPTLDQISKLESVYERIIKPFSTINQD